MGHATVEWVYVGVVISLLTYVGAESWNVERVLEHAPQESEIIKVTGQQWFWTFEHADGTKEIGELHVKKGIPTDLRSFPKMLSITLMFLILLS